MPNPTKRYYRVAERDHELDDDLMFCDETTMKNVCAISICIYMLSIFISFLFGCLVGSRDKNCM